MAMSMPWWTQNWWIGRRWLGIREIRALLLFMQLISWGFVYFLLLCLCFAQILLAWTEHCSKGSMSLVWQTGTGAQAFFYLFTLTLFVLPLILFQISGSIHFLVVNQMLPFHRLIFLSLTFKRIDKQPDIRGQGIKNTSVMFCWLFPH